jgi:hypothetical protein
LAERTVSSRSSTGRSRIGSTWRDAGFSSAIGVPSSGEDRQLLDQDASGVADGFFRLDGAVGLDVDDQLVEVGALLDAGGLDRIGRRGEPG